MILSAHQPAYLPWLGLFHKIALCDTFVILDDVQYEKNSFINRNKIKTAQGEIWLTVPVLNKGHMDKTIKQMEIDLKLDWKSKHWKSIYMNYRKAPFFLKHADEIEFFYRKDWKNLNEFLCSQLRFFLGFLNIDVKIINQSDLITQHKKQDLIIELCKKLNANTFVFGRNGIDYVNESVFVENNIKVYFQNFCHPVYPQLFEEFLPGMSIIDAIFNIGSEKIMETIMSINDNKGRLIECSQ